MVDSVELITLQSFTEITCDKPFLAISRVGLLSFVGITFCTRESTGLEDKVTRRQLFHPKFHTDCSTGVLISL